MRVEACDDNYSINEDNDDGCVHPPPAQLIFAVCT